MNLKLISELLVQKKIERNEKFSQFREEIKCFIEAVVEFNPTYPVYVGRALCPVNTVRNLL